MLGRVSAARRAAACSRCEGECSGWWVTGRKTGGASGGERRTGRAGKVQKNPLASRQAICAQSPSGM